MRARYRLQSKQTIAIPNILGNHSMPVYSYRWIDYAVSNDLESLTAIVEKGQRIIDTQAEDKVVC